MAEEDTGTPQEMKQVEKEWEKLSKFFSDREVSAKTVLFWVGILVAIVVIIILAAPFLLGAFTRAGFSTWSITQGISGIFGSYSFRKLIYEVTHPFEVEPETAEVEETPYKQQTMEGLKVEVTAYQDKVLYGQPFAIGIRIKNLGNKEIKRVDIEFSNPSNPRTGLLSGYEYKGCFDISEMQCTGVTVEYNGDFEDYTFVFHVDNIPPGGEKDIICNNIKLKKECEPTESGEGYPHVLAIRGYTYYVSNSRLPIEVIDNEYAQTLMKNKRFYTTTQRATAELGSPVRINLNTLADQPILDSIGQTSVMIGYEVVGSGKLAMEGGNPKYPLLFITTEKSPIDMGAPTMYGEGCIAEGEVASSNIGDGSCCFDNFYWGCEICDSNLKSSCVDGVVKQIQNEIAKYSDEVTQMITTYCELAGFTEKHVCFNTLLRQEFEGYVIPNVKIPDIQTKRETFYVTVTAIYPYASESYVTIYGIVP